MESKSYAANRHFFPPLRDDVQAAVEALGSRNDAARNLEQAGDFTLDLSGSDLVGARLREVDFGRANLSGARLIHADLTASNLSFARLDGADLTYAELSDADCSSALFVGSQLVGLVARSTNFSSAVIAGADLSHAQLEGSHFNDAFCGDVRLIEANISGTDFRTDHEKKTTRDSISPFGYYGPTTDQINQARWAVDNPPLLSAIMNDT